ncbi:MAG: hypothetical protein ABEN55_18950, partial [Bradymonadaceae bacterium]
MDMEGHLVHEWSRPLRGVWSDPPHLDELPPEQYVIWRRARPFPNGDILAIYSSVAVTPGGIGLVKLDKDSEVLWRYPANVHHDFTVAADGSIYTLVHELRSTGRRPVAGMEQLPRIIVEEYLVKLSAGGEELSRLNLLDLIADSEYRSWLEACGPREASPVRTSEGTDLLHANTVEIVDRTFAEANS